MTDLEAKEMLETLQHRAEVDVRSIEVRIEELKRDFEADPWEDTERQIHRLENRLVVRGDEAKALAIAITKFEGVK